MRSAQHFLALMAIGAGLWNGAAVANDATSLASSCRMCHLPGGARTAVIPSLDGANRDSIKASLAAFRTGEKPGVVMRRLAETLSEAEVDAVASALAAPGARP